MGSIPLIFSHIFMFIGVVLLVVLALLLLLLVLLLFWPICYKLDFDAPYGGDISCIIRVNWLFLRFFKGDFKDGKLSWRLYIPFIMDKGSMKAVKPEPDTAKSKSEAVKSKSEADKSKSEAVKSKTGLDKRNAVQGFQDSPHEASVKPKEVSFEPVKSIEVSSEPVKSIEAGSEHFKTEKITEEKVKPEQETAKRESFITRLKNKITGIIDFIRRILERPRAIEEKLDNIFEYLRKDNTDYSLTKLKKELLKIIRAVVPKKLKGNIAFGFQDPYYTGRLLGFLSLLYPLYGEHIALHPDYQDQVFWGDLKARGGFQVISLVVAALRLVFDKKVRRSLDEALGLLS